MEGQQYRDISVLEPLSDAYDRMKLILFDPFNMEKWFTIGFCAWLAQLGSQAGGSGGGGGGSWYPPGQNGGGTPADIKNALMPHMPLIITISVIVLVIALVIALVVTWLNSRGKFMFLDCVANNTAEVIRPWTQYRDLGNSLFKFRLVVGFTILFLIALLVGTSFFVFFTFVHNAPEGEKAPLIILIISVLALFIPIGIIVGLIKKFTNDFIVPIMYLRHCSCTDAWREFLDLAGRNKGALVLYVLFGILLGMATGLTVMALVLGTCCLACCVLIIPYLGTVLLLPIFTFLRCYSLFFLRQFGDQFDVFPGIAQPGSPEPYIPPGVEPFQ